MVPCRKIVQGVQVIVFNRIPLKMAEMKIRTLFEKMQVFSFYFRQMQHCLFCGHLVTLVHVHGHYQCPVCFTNALPCCDGDNCDTNVLLKDELSPRQKLNSGKSVQECDKTDAS